MEPQNSTAVASLLNLSAILFFIPVMLALAVLIWFILNSPLGTPVLHFWAKQHMQKKRYRKAAELYERLHHFHELMGDTEFARQAGIAYEMSGDLKSALKHYAAAQDWGKLGQLQMETGQWEEALQSFTEGNLPGRMVLCYEHFNDYYAAALIYEQELHQLHKARIFYERALSAAEDEMITLQALFGLLRVDQSLGRTEEAQATVQRIRETFAAAPHLAEDPALAQSWKELQAAT